MMILLSLGLGPKLRGRGHDRKGRGPDRMPRIGSCLQLPSYTLLPAIEVRFQALTSAWPLPSRWPVMQTHADVDRC
jgi:hypothetical protein